MESSNSTMSESWKMPPLYLRIVGGYLTRITFEQPKSTMSPHAYYA
jgi:hypothetical protein